MKSMIAAALLCAAGAAHGHTEYRQDGNAKTSAVVVQSQGALAVQVEGKLIHLNGPVVYDAKGQRSSARLTPGMAVTFVLAPEGTMPRIKEVWTTK